MGTAERISLKIQFEHLIAAIAANCPQLERLEFRWIQIINPRTIKNKTLFLDGIERK